MPIRLIKTFLLHPQTTLVLRAVQLPSISITGFLACLFIWLHQHHSCAFSPEYCSNKELKHVKVPWGYPLVLTGCLVAYLEWYLYAAEALFRGASSPWSGEIISLPSMAVRVLSLILLTVGYGGLWTMEEYHEWCYFDKDYSIWTSPETRWCVVQKDLIGTGAFAVGLTVFVLGVGLLALWCERAKRTSDEPEDGTAERTEPVPDMVQQS